MGQNENNDFIPENGEHSTFIEHHLNAGVIRELGDLPSGTIITEKALGKVFNRHLVSIKRAIERGELPPSVRLFGESVWTVDILLEHMNNRLQKAQQQSEKLHKKIGELGA
jgi:hypothetical protein